MKYYQTFLLVISVNMLFSQYTLKFDDKIGPPNASLTDVSWIAGNWVGNQLGGSIEEIWLPPHGDSMMGAFKLVVEGKVQFYELMTISQVDDTLLLRIKHFGNDLKGWEEKDESEEFKLVKIKPNWVYFNNLSFEKVSDTEMNIYVVFKDKNGSEQEVVFNYSLK